MAKLKLALMDMYDGIPNQGMRCLRTILEDVADDIEVDEFNVRQKNEVPGLDYHIYISSGGPGDPRKGNGVWDKKWNSLIDGLWKHNRKSDQKKYVFFICHSFQMACHHFGLAQVTKRKSTSFGVYPIHKTAAGSIDPLLQDLDDPYYGVDSRDWQLVKPKVAAFKMYQAKILSLEKIRTHVEYERAIMAMRFSSEMVGTQFHAEADPVGMKEHFQKKENRDKVIKNFDESKYHKMMEYLDQPEAVLHTFNTVIPGFLQRAISKLTSVQLQ